MTHEQFGQLVEKLETFSVKKPKRFKTKILLLALSSYGYIWFMLLLAAGLTVFTIYLMVSNGRLNVLIGKFAFVTIAFAFTILKALWIKSSKPEGHLIEENEAPELHLTVRDIQKKLRAPKVHAIVLTEDFNAAMFQRPRLGSLGWYKNYLILGLPYMQTLSKEEFDSVIAHELGHLSKAHSKFSGWIYKVRVTWFQVIQQLQEKESRALFLFRKYFEWFIPKFNAYSFVLARQNEYEADSLAAQYSGNHITGEALTRSHMIGMTLPKFWAEHYQRSLHQEECEPPYRLLSHFLEDQTHLDETLLRKCQLEETGYLDTHPVLKERLRALQHEPAIPGIPEENAADYYFKGKQEKYIDGFDQAWKDIYQVKWAEEYEKAQKMKGEWKELNGKESLTAEEAKEKAILYNQLFGEEKGVQEYIRLADNYSEYNEDPSLYYHIGKTLLDSYDDDGIDYIEKTMELDWSFRLSGLLLLRYHYQVKNDVGKEEEIDGRLAKWTQLLNDSEEEISEFSADQELFPVEDEEEIQALRIQLCEYEIQRIYYAKRQLKSLPERQIRLLGIEFTEQGKSQEYYERYRAKIRDNIHYSFETYLFILNLGEEWADRVASVDNSLIFDADTQESDKKEYSMG